MEEATPTLSSPGLAEGAKGRELHPPPPQTLFSFLCFFFYIVSDLFFHSIILKDSGV